MTIVDSLKWRYATKKFDPKRILSNEKISTLKQAFNLTALSYGLQTLKLVVIKDETIRETLVASSYGQRQVADASHLLVICIQNEIDEADVKQHYSNIKGIRNTPSEILKPFENQLKATIEKMPDSQKRDWAIRQAYIALGNLMTVCAVEEIDSCPMEGFIPNKIDEILGLKKLGLNSVLLLPVGFRAKDDMFSALKKVRKPLSESVIEL